jgi:hypothetical protein
LPAQVDVGESEQEKIKEEEKKVSKFENFLEASEKINNITKEIEENVKIRVKNGKDFKEKIAKICL